MEGYLQDRCQGLYAIEVLEGYIYNKEERYVKDAYYLNGEAYDFVVGEWIKKMALEQG